MKRFIAAFGLAAVTLSASALEFGPPHEQLNVERALPQIEFAPVEPYVSDSSAPYEQLAIDRALPNLPVRNVQFAATVGSTQSDATVDGNGNDETPAESPWANDHNFIAPAQ
jgi:hypothetical protein